MADLSYHYLAFIDILGFSEMVRKDCESPPGEDAYLSRLLQLHSDTKAAFAAASDTSLVQFSDSIVVSAPYRPEGYSGFLQQIASYQLHLLLEGFLVRGGIACGRHFSQGDFMFSQGLVEAYHIESRLAKYPRVVVSRELMDLVCDLPGEHLESAPLVSDRDGVVFVDYLHNADLGRLFPSVKTMVTRARTMSPRVAEKLVWLGSYFDFKAEQQGFDGRVSAPEFVRV